jgi:hypothetical protein
MTRSTEGSARPAHATEMIGAREPRVEVLDPATQSVWQSIRPIAPDVWEAVELEPPWVTLRFGPGVPIGAMDEHWFDRSPGAEVDGPTDEQEIGGHRFAFCARPLTQPELPGGPEGPRQLLIDKHHGLLFHAGRRIEILTLPDGRHFVHTIEGGAGKPPLALPEGWHLGFVELVRDWVVRLPAPTTVFLFPNGDSFQGPVETP